MASHARGGGATLATLIRKPPKWVFEARLVTGGARHQHKSTTTPPSSGMLPAVYMMMGNQTAVTS